MDLSTFVDEFTRRDWQVSDPGDGPVRFAVVGLGWWTREEAIPAIEDSQLCETTVAVSSTSEKAERVASEAGMDAGITYEAFHDGAAADAYDAVYVCTPNATHLEFVETAADLDKPVLCEKPMEASVERAEQLVAAAADVTVMVAYRMHLEPTVRRLRELLRDGYLGDPVQLHGHMSQQLLAIIPDPDQWRLNPDLAGPGATVTDIGVYPLNTTRFLLEADPVAVQSTTYSAADAFADVPDERVSFTAEFPDGVVATCSASQNAYHTSRLTVVGTAGEARLDQAFFPDSERTLRVTRGETTAETTVSGVDQMREEFDYFADCLLTDREPEADAEHGLTDVRTIEAVYEAAERGERVRL